MGTEYSKKKYTTKDLQFMAAPTDKVRTVEMNAHVTPHQGTPYNEQELLSRHVFHKDQGTLLNKTPLIIFGAVFLLYTLMMLKGVTLLLYVIVMIGSRLR
jgi:hypothetical protein